MSIFKILSYWLLDQDDHGRLRCKKSGFVTKSVKKAVSRICCKFKVKFLCTECNSILSISNFQTTNLLRFMILQNFWYTAAISSISKVL